ncbi:hypothetical protein EDI_146010 [Entamoeba dispar SAW760]|uniref:Uncharacterized protein n=1 Tax=Entamoeba dispar (strain ATCC PRA-260 / SAW760) TaxID=370354 RepID=B0EUA4_ENTDS|nr:uncharacterized protein EDI_146010 [Entamoeba dispar SAW760]EDR21893.1 hypothetical protein EDI_146010 [Entamoeba dispar SAW760]|eukprot:EDR21893.1 hypothetical protein EDI_146010 [Entamoeba dispar SAW760]
MENEINDCPIGRASFMRMKKRQSRDEEASFSNAYLFFLLSECGASASLKYTKGAQKTVKLYVVDTITIDGKLLTSQTIREKGRELLIEKKWPIGNIKFETMSLKQQKRSGEAETCNGYLKILMERKFVPEFKQTKSSKKTVKMLRITKLKTPLGKCYNKDLLRKVGIKFDEVVQKGFKGYKTLNLNKLFVQEICQMSLNEIENPQQHEFMNKDFVWYFDDHDIFIKTPTMIQRYVSFDTIPILHFSSLSN